MSKCLSIAMVIYRLSPKGGLEDNCLRVAETLVSRGHRPVIFTGEPAIIPGIETRQMQGATVPKSNHRRMEQLAQLAREVISEGQFDRSIAFQMMPGTDFVFLADPIREATGRNSWKWLTGRYHVYKSLEARTLRNGSVSKLIGLSQTQMQPFVRQYNLASERFRIAPPTLNPAKIRPQTRNAQSRASIRTALGIRPDTPVLLSAALHGWVKGIDRTIDALSTMQEAVLLVAGIAETSNAALDIRKRIKRRNLQSRVRFLGFMGTEGLLDVMSAADVLAHPARREVTGAVILEAIVNGLPVVATDVCGFSTHIEQAQAGEVLHGRFDLGSYRRALDRVISNSAALSKNGIAYGRDPSLSSGIDTVCDWIERGF
jgi:UDP-glucose:(heptosyl)LPS alpha-1,3-glucosyltransferase